MATHECTGCLQETIQGAIELVDGIVLPHSICPAPGGGRHSWVRKSQPPALAQTASATMSGLELTALLPHILYILCMR
jgi:hypothetical protein